MMTISLRRYLLGSLTRGLVYNCVIDFFFFFFFFFHFFWLQTIISLFPSFFLGRHVFPFTFLTQQICVDASEELCTLLREKSLCSVSSFDSVFFF